VNEKFQAAMLEYHKCEHARAERCLGDIIEILGTQKPEDEQVVQVLDRLIEHYKRDMRGATRP
jgi:hypothetical protein